MHHSEVVILWHESGVEFLGFKRGGDPSGSLLDFAIKVSWPRVFLGLGLCCGQSTDLMEGRLGFSCGCRKQSKRSEVGHTVF